MLVIDGVTYLPVAGFNGRYVVGDDGDVRDIRNGGWNPAPRMSSGKYIGVRLSAGDYWYRSVPLHRLVLETFVGPRPPGMHGCHRDGDRNNNSISNLRWDTPESNAADSIRNGATARGSRNGCARLTEDDIASIRNKFDLGLSQPELAREFGVHQSIISSILIGETWKHCQLRNKHYKTGDIVSWWSTAKGTRLQKTGTVAAVVPPGKTPAECIDLSAFNQSKIWESRSRTRSEASYLVSVRCAKTIGSKAKPDIYWPRVSGLSISNANTQSNQCDTSTAA